MRTQRDIRARAEAALQHMQAPSLFRCGLTCDYTSECVAFLRNFDVDDPDVSLILRSSRNLLVDKSHCLWTGTSSVMLLALALGTARSLSPSWCMRRSRSLSRALHALEGPATCIALPFCLSCARICYGSRVHYLCTKASIPEVRATAGAG